ncbi:MAG TPA: DsbA family protein, partial [Dehalococcoidia bacterium]|nr:DsbA family protein [Dehalococcoidia bacterium]
MADSDFTIFYDFRCPFVYNATMWLEKVKKLNGKGPNVDWQPFSLAQINSDKGEDFKYWERPEARDGSDNTLLAHRAGLAAKRQGLEAFDAFRISILKARHEDKKDLMDPAVVEEAAIKSGIDVGQFKEDLADRDLLRQIGESHTRAVEEYGAFGVPTYVFPSGNAAFIKMFIPPDDQAVEVYNTLTKFVGDLKHVGEVKRPQPSWP